MASWPVLHDVPSPGSRSLRHLLVAPLLASIAAAAGVFIVFGGWRPFVWESFEVSLLYSTSISLCANLVMPGVVRRIAPRRTPPTVVMAIILVGAAAIGSLIAGALGLAIGLDLLRGFWTTYWQMARITAALALVSGFALFFYGSLTSDLRQARTALREKDLAETRAQKRALEARLSSLESRVHPHFLFNTLNSLSALIRVDAARAEALVQRLASLLRSSLAVTPQGGISLEREAAIVRDYLSIEQERLGARLSYDVRIPDEVRACLVPPFAVQSLVENSVKHGIGAVEAAGRIDVAARLIAGELHVSVRDTGPGFDLAGVPPGHGIENLVERLHASYGTSARIEVRRQPPGCEVLLCLPVRDIQDTPR